MCSTDLGGDLQGEMQGDAGKYRGDRGEAGRDVEEARAFGVRCREMQGDIGEIWARLSAIGRTCGPSRGEFGGFGVILVRNWRVCARR